LHNDNVNTYTYVILNLINLIKLDLPEAIQKTIEVDTKGLAVVAITHKEHAELLQEQLKSVFLICTIEPS